MEDAEIVAFDSLRLVDNVLEFVIEDVKLVVAGDEVDIELFELVVVFLD